MQALKALVIAMGVLIVAGLAVVAVTLYKRGTQYVADAGPAAPAGAPAAPGFGTKEVAIPAGATVRRVSAEGDRLVVELDLANGAPGVVVIDLRDGSVLGRIDFRPQAP
jgi:hypothetical protein